MSDITENTSPRNNALILVKILLAVALTVAIIFKYLRFHSGALHNLSPLDAILLLLLFVAYLWIGVICFGLVVAVFGWVATFLSWFREWLSVLRTPVDQRWEGINDLSGVDYYSYLRSDEWKQRRDFTIQRAGYRCQVCNQTEKLEVHHRTYERLGAERAEDLTVLCAKCHALFHGSHQFTPRPHGK